MLRDIRGAVWDWLGEENPVAATCRELQTCRVARREAAATQREETTSGPTGTSGRLAASDQRRQELRSTLDTQQENARQQEQTNYSDVDATVVLLGRVGAPTTALWSALTDEASQVVAGRPAQPTTATVTVGPHTLAVAETPGIPGTGGFPEWLTKAVPGLPAALERADCVLGLGEHHEPLLDAVAETFDATCRSLSAGTADEARAELREVFNAEEYAVQLPYSDAAQALVSRLHDEAVVHETEYSDAVYLRVEVAETGVPKLRRHVSSVDGELKPVRSQ